MNLQELIQEARERIRRYEENLKRAQEKVSRVSKEGKERVKKAERQTFDETLKAECASEEAQKKLRAAWQILNSLEKIREVSSEDEE